MSDEKKKEKGKAISDCVNQMDETRQAYFMGFVEGMAASADLTDKKEESEDG